MAGRLKRSRDPITTVLCKVRGLFKRSLCTLCKRGTCLFLYKVSATHLRCILFLLASPAFFSQRICGRNMTLHQYHNQTPFNLKPHPPILLSPDLVRTSSSAEPKPSRPSSSSSSSDSPLPLPAPSSSSSFSSTSSFTSGFASSSPPASNSCFPAPSLLLAFASFSALSCSELKKKKKHPCLH